MPGKRTLVQIAETSTGTYKTVERIRVGQVRTPGTNINVTKQSANTSFVRRIQGLLDATWIAGGMWRPEDLEGQYKIWESWKNDTPLSIRILPEGSTEEYFHGSAKVNQFRIRSNIEGEVQVLIALTGTGEVSTIPPPEVWSTLLTRPSTDIVASSTDVVGDETADGGVIIELLFDL